MAEINVRAPFKYTFPVSKAFVGSDGRRRIEGAATGPEVDLQNQRVASTLISKWVDMVNNGLMPLTYDDNHRSEQEVITTELGTIEKAWKDDRDHMWVSVVLDDDNPVAQYIHKAAMNKGKQYGMSIFGEATAYIDEVIGGKNVRTITDGFLTRIAHTTRPVWTPSLGTVISKAVDSAVSEETVTDAEKTTTTETVEEVTTPDTGAAETTDSGAATAPDTGNAPDSADGSASADATVEKAVKPETKKDEKVLAGLVKTYQSLGAQLREAGLLTEEPVKDDQGGEKTIVKSENTEVAQLSKSVSELASIVTALADRVTDGSAPGVLRKSEPVDPLAELTAVADPIERLRLSLAVKHGENS